MTDTIQLPKPSTLRPLEERPFGYGGGGIPLDLARWLRTYPVDKIEMGPKPDTIRLWSGRGNAVTPFGHALGLGPSKTIDGETTLVTVPDFIVRQIDPIVEWERRNPEERRFGEKRIELQELKISAAHLLGTPAGPERIGVLDRLLSLYGENWKITSLRQKLREDPHDAHGTCIKVVSEITDL